MNKHITLLATILAAVTLSATSAEAKTTRQDKSMIISDGGKNYFVNQHSDGSSTTFTDKGAIYVQPNGDNGYRIINTGNAPVPAAIMPVIAPPSDE